MDPFVPALEELSQALASGEDPEQALAEIAEEYRLAAYALRNRAVRAFGSLETYQERQAALKQERQRSAIRSDPALAAASFLAELANLSPKLSQVEWDTQVQRLATEFGIDPAAHRSAISRARRRP
jgi:uncharacterized tellurite resistance protein B-like protein